VNGMDVPTVSGGFNPERSGPRAPLARQLTWWILVLPLLMLVAILTKSLYLLDYSHVLSAVLWTGADLFLGFVLGPVLRHISPEHRRALIRYLVPKTVLYMPTVAFTTVVAGGVLANWFGFLTPGTPDVPWIIAAAVVATILVIQGGVISWNEFRVLRELDRPAPDEARIVRWNGWVFRLAAVQAILQVLVVLVMAHLTVG
jgi:uncharacterized membrane protein